MSELRYLVQYLDDDGVTWHTTASFVSPVDADQWMQFETGRPTKLRVWDSVLSVVTGEDEYESPSGSSDPDGDS